MSQALLQPLPTGVPGIVPAPGPALVPAVAVPAWGGRLGAAARSLARELPLTLTVRGHCMAPRLRDGDRVEVAPARRYWPGDVVAFETPQGRIAVHRLLGYRPLAGRLALVTRGDRCREADAPLAVARLIGRAAVPASAADRWCAALAFLGLALGAVRRRLAG
jgi:hypothetical protein